VGFSPACEMLPGAEAAVSLGECLGLYAEALVQGLLSGRA
jgi:hypothetical protein